MDSNLNRSASAYAPVSRFYETDDDLQQMLSMLMEARSQTSDWRYAHVGELLFNFFMVACHLDPRQHIRLWHADDRLVAYALLGEDPAFDYQILPEYAWRGIETEALTWAEERVAELRAQDSQLWGGALVSGARQDDQERIAFLEQHGFKYVGDFAEVNMIRPLSEPIPTPHLPAGFTVRALHGADEIPKRAAAQREVWQPWSVGNVSDDDYAQFMRLPGYLLDLDVVTVTPQGVIAAYVNGWLDPVNRIGDFGPVGALAAYRRQGLTRAALLESLHRMQAHGMDRVCISTGVDNTPAINLYQSVGFKIVNKYLDYAKPN
jgi:ribosomal protein S18 acetylase RimI-like enzyme